MDEVQFFDNSIVNVCKELASNNKRVIAAGLDTDYLGKPFGPMPEIMCEADYLDKLRAIVYCVEILHLTHKGQLVMKIRLF